MSDKDSKKPAMGGAGGPPPARRAPCAADAALYMSSSSSSSSSGSSSSSSSSGTSGVLRTGSYFMYLKCQFTPNVYVGAEAGGGGLKTAAASAGPAIIDEKKSIMARGTSAAIYDQLRFNLKYFARIAAGTWGDNEDDHTDGAVVMNLRDKEAHKQIVDVLKEHCLNSHYKSREDYCRENGHERFYELHYINFVCVREGSTGVFNVGMVSFDMEFMLSLFNDPTPGNPKIVVKVSEGLKQSPADKRLAEFMNTIIHRHMIASQHVGSDSVFGDKILTDLNTQFGGRTVKYLDDPMIDPPEFLNDGMLLFRYQKASIYWMMQREENGLMMHVSPHKCIFIVPTLEYDPDVRLDDDTWVFGYQQQKVMRFRDLGEFRTSGGMITDDVGLGKSVQLATLSLIRYTGYPSLFIIPDHLIEHWRFEINKFIKKNFFVDTERRDMLMRTVSSCYDYGSVENHRIILIPVSAVVSSASGLGESLSTYDTKLDKIRNLRKKMRDTHHLFAEEFSRVVVDEFHELYNDLKSKAIVLTLLSVFRNTPGKSVPTAKWGITATPFTMKDALIYIWNFLNDNVTGTNEDQVSNPQIARYEYLKPLYNELFRRNTKKSIVQEWAFPGVVREVHTLKFTPTERSVYDAEKIGKNDVEFLRRLCAVLTDGSGNFDIASVSDLQEKMLFKYKNAFETANENLEEYCRRKAEDIMRINELPRERIDFLKRTTSQVLFTPEERKFAAILSDIASLEMEITKTRRSYEFYKNQIDKVTGIVEKPETSAAKPASGGGGAAGPVVPVVDDVITKTVEATEDDAEEDDDDDDDDDDEDEGETCGICLGTVDKDDAGITSCGHIGCFNCITVWVAQNHRCMNCGTALNKSGVSKIIKANSKVIDYVKQYGTKMAYLLKLFIGAETSKFKPLRGKTIVYCQWQEVIMKMIAVCRAHLPESTMTYTAKNILEYKSYDGSAILFLSSETNNSGFNLTETDNIVIFEPINGNYRKQFELENQILGRAHRIGRVGIVRMVKIFVLGTVEEQIMKTFYEHASQMQDASEFLSVTDYSLVECL